MFKPKTRTPKKIYIDEMLSRCDLTAIVPARPEPRSARIALGMTVYNGERYLQEAIESVLAQNYSDFILMILDDHSKDRSTEILNDYALRDPRIMFFRNRHRNGMIAAWVRVFRLAQRYCPAHHYFSWCSDHDILLPDWLGRLAEVLDSRPDVVMAYPETLNIDNESKLLDKPLRPRRFNSDGIDNPFRRFYHINRYISGAGNMIYGLMRSEALHAVDVYRPVLQPDRLALTELSLIGQIHQVPQVLRYRRVTGAASIERQKQTLFDPNQTVTVTTPWYLMHAVAFFRAYSQSLQYGCPRVLALSLAILCWQLKADVGKKLFHLKRKLRSLYRSIRISSSSG